MRDIIDSFSSGIPAILLIFGPMVFYIVRHEIRFRRIRSLMLTEKKAAENEVNRIQESIQQLVEELNVKVEKMVSNGVEPENIHQVNDIILDLMNMIGDKELTFTVDIKRDEQKKYNFQSKREIKIKVKDVVMIKTRANINSRFLLKEIPCSLEESDLKKVDHEVLSSLNLDEFSKENEQYFLRVSKDIICNKQFIKRSHRNPTKQFIISKDEQEIYIPIPRKVSTYHDPIMIFLDEIE